MEFLSPNEKLQDLARSELVTVGDYLLRITVPNATQRAGSIIVLQGLKGIAVPLPFLGKDIRLENYGYGVDGYDSSTVTMRLNVLQNPFAVDDLIIGITALLGLGILAVIVVQVARIVEALTGEGGQTLSIGIVALILFGGVYLISKIWRPFSG